MPQMRVKAAVSNWSDLNEDDYHIKSMVASFFDCSKMYLYGQFSSSGEYDHLVGNWQSDKIVKATVSDRRSFAKTDVKMFSVDVPYINGSLPVGDITVVGNERVGLFPDITTDLTTKQSNMYLLQYNFTDDDVSAEVHCNLLHSNESTGVDASVTLSTYLGSSINTDTNVKPVDIQYVEDQPQKQLVTIKKVIPPAAVTYHYKTDVFTLKLKGPGSIESHSCYYKIGLTFFTEAANNEVTYSADPSNFTNYKLSIGDHGITLDGKNTFSFYFKNDESSATPFIALFKYSEDTQKYYDVPVSVVFPLYLDSTDICGLVYMKLYNQNGDTFEYEANKFTFDGINDDQYADLPLSTIDA